MESYLLPATGCIFLTLISVAYLVHHTHDTFTSHNGKGRRIPVLPFALPFIGHLLQFLWSTEKLLTKASTYYGPDTPVQIKLLNRRMTILNGSNNIIDLFKSSRSVNSERWLIQVLVNAFGIGTNDVPFYLADNTGVSQQPAPHSNAIPYDHRIFHLVYQTVHDGLSGERLEEMQNQLVCNLSTQLADMKVEFNSWTLVPDVYELLIRDICFKASTVSLCGPRIFEAVPNLTSDFWNFDSHLPSLFKEMPRWLAPTAFKARDRMKENMRKWHELAHKGYDISQNSTDTRNWEENFGSKLMRSRHAFFSKMPLSKDTIAADDLGLLWAATANAIPAIGWMILEVVQRPALLSKVRAEITPFMGGSSPSKTSIPDIDIDGLCQQPLVQSIYAEVLRIHNGTVVARVPQVLDFSIAGWTFPKDHPIMISTFDTARKPSIWNQGTPNEPHPVDEFWPERFIVDAKDHTSGPTLSQNRLAKTKDESSKPYFTLEGTIGSWIPYGGGSRMCPGRHFAKKELIVTMAMFLTTFDIELEPLDKWIRNDAKYFMFGVMHPEGPIPARIRRRATDI
ncbi:cytochrome P450 monooxygenase 7a1 [Fusarium heterosporum]|uniref:Cytochrome P450 monooxygenase 7a1 n=1 Tax=Fusarium heterosporum TaxID=42747 RepID=A0A8H5WLE9_FUSHE|nr:cytochrome P450 monooxygenase 7a1 [Fusarium heterosporum]